MVAKSGWGGDPATGEFINEGPHQNCAVVFPSLPPVFFSVALLTLYLPL